MEVPVEGEFDVEVETRGWTPEQRLRVIADIANGSFLYLKGAISTTIEVEPPERDDR